MRFFINNRKNIGEICREINRVIGEEGRKKDQRPKDESLTVFINEIIT
jgi:hypothetical protein